MQLKRIILEVILGLCVLGLGAFSFFQFSKISELKEELAQVVQFQEESKKLKEELASNAQELADLRIKGGILDASKAALASGVALRDIQAAATAESAASTEEEIGESSENSRMSSDGMTPDRLLATGALRMLIYGETDQKALTAFEKALEIVDLQSKLKAVCAAQAGIVASGKQINVLSECVTN